MFLPNSRYAGEATVQTKTSDGRAVTALTLRRLPRTFGELRAVKDNDRLDLIAQEKYANGRWFWHIADANTALEARELTAKTGSIINVPAT